MTPAPPTLPATPMDVLVIEDDLVDEMALTRTLRNRPTPYRVQIARSVADARTVLAAQHFDVILADHQLGDGTAFDLMDAFVGQLVIFITGAGDEDMAVRALQQGAHDFLLKDPDRGYLKLLPWRLDMALTHVQQTRALHALVQEKTALLKEVHHRVKNNLQVVTSLLRLEASRGTAIDAKTVLGEMQGRIHSMALLHESLYRGDALGRLDLATYLRQLSQQAFRTHATHGLVRLDVDVASVSVGLEQATPAGLLVNELISNCLKHAFPPGRSGVVWVSLQPGADQQWCLQVRDNGVGLPANFAQRRTESLGLQLVDDLAAQMRGTLRIASPVDGAGAQGGTVFDVIFSSQIGL